MSLFDVNEVEKEALAEVAKERSDNARKKLKAKLVEIEKSKAVTRNLEAEYAALKLEITEDV